MNLFAKLKGMELSSLEQQVVGLIHQDPIQFTKMSIDTISERAFVSKSTVYRLCNKLGYEGLNELKLMVTASFSDQLIHEKKEINPNMPFTQADSEFTIVANMRNLYDHAIFLASNYLDMKTLKVTALDILRAQTVFVFTDEEHVQLAEIFRDRMTSVDVNVVVATNDFLKVAHCEKAGVHDVAVYISDRPSHKKHAQYLKMLKGNRCKIILITDYSAELLRNLSDRFIQLRLSDRKESISDFETRIILQFIFDCIYSVCFRENYEKNLEKRKVSYLKFENM